MDEKSIKSTVELAGAIYCGIQKGAGILVTDPITKSTVSVPLDPFFSDNNNDAIDAVRCAILCCRAYFNAPKIAKDKVAANVFESISCIQEKINKLTVFIHSSKGLEQVDEINARIDLIKHYLELE